jgi:hypothetical protein
VGGALRPRGVFRPSTQALGRAAIDRVVLRSRNMFATGRQVWRRRYGRIKTVGDRAAARSDLHRADRHRPRRRRPIAIDLGDDTPIVRRTSTQRAAVSKPSSVARLSMFPRQPVKHVLGQIRQASGGTRQRATLSDLQLGTKLRWHVVHRR